MKIVLLTTLPQLIENERLKKEAQGLGHQFKVVDLSDFTFDIEGQQLKIGGLTNFKADLVIIRGIFNSIKPITALVKNLRKQGIKVFDNNFLRHKYSIDKVTDLIKLTHHRIPVPRTCYSRDFNQYPALAEKIGYPVVVKSVRTGKGASVFKLETESELVALIDELANEAKPAKGYILQEFIPYEHDLRCLVVGQEVFSMKRIPAEGEFRANFSLGGKVELFNLDQAGENLAIRALKAVGLNIGGVDVLITKDNRRYILEVNHTAGFVGMEQATGKNIAKVWLEQAIKLAK